MFDYKGNDYYLARTCLGKLRYRVKVAKSLVYLFLIRVQHLLMEAKLEQVE
jgi:hypothetical protein